MPRRHVLLALAVAVVWGVNFVVIHVGLDSFPPLLFAALRFTLVALPLVFFVKRPAIDWRWIVAVGTFLSTGQFALLFVAMDNGLPAGLASLVIQLQALFTIGLAVAFLNERPTRGQLAGAAVAMAGIAVIALGRSATVPLLGLVLCVGAAASWGVGNVLTRLAKPPNAFSLMIWSSLVAPIPLFVLSLVFEGPAAAREAFAGLDFSGVLALLYVVIGASIFGYGVWTWLLKRHEATRVAPFALLVPVAGIASAWIALGEKPGAAELAGAALILIGLGIAMRALGIRAGGARVLAGPPQQLSAHETV
jgi:O-acetylserine/cysteine efflux transporter